ncbi:flagellar filament capping protein FliD [Dickeya lacustris]|uniref:Flagellar hook-associated protein 2 n=1 Tax=Dickeya lacustris TaxID=2259638 RepID=A0ABY8G6I0_9GAMM|nr:flagellar filament capping protein FliD [Dickeya lacustris]WFN55565.1 flagellar filament capping protein FliD [Dickeya lacustris]
MATLVSNTTSLLGLSFANTLNGSSLNLTTLLTNLQTSEQARLTPYTNKQNTLTAQSRGLSAVEAALNSLNTATTTLKNFKTISSTTVNSTNTSFGVTTDSSAVAGVYSLSVSKLAQAQAQISGGFSSASTALVTGGTSSTSSVITINQASQSKPLTVTLTDDKTSLNDIRDAINNAGGSVSATVVNNGSQSYLMLTAKDTGTKSAMSVSVSGALATPLGSFTENVAAQDAAFKLNGMDVTSQSNTVSTAISGVTLTLKSTSSSATPETLTIGSDTSSTKKAIQDWVSAYNNVLDVIKTQTNYSAPSSTEKASGSQSSSNGALMGNSTVSQIQARLQGQLTNVQTGNDSLRILADLGITQDPLNNGKLKVDSAKLDSALKTNSSAVGAFFAGDGSTTGFATQASKYLDSVLNTTNGVLKSVKDGLASSQTSVANQIQKINDSIDNNMARYQKQFAQLSSLMSKLSSQNNYLTQQFKTNSSSS